MQGKSSTLRTVVLAIVIGMFGSCGACFVWLAAAPEGGVRTANQMEQYALDYIEEHRLLERDEKIIAYYDGSVSMDANPSTILTNTRIIHHVDGRNTAIRIDDIEDMTWRDEGLIGIVIDIHSTGGEVMRLEVAPLNSGDLLVRELERVIERAKDANAQATEDAAADDAIEKPKNEAPADRTESRTKGLHERP